MDVYFAFVIILLSAQSLSAIRFPQNSAVLVGQSVIFHCGTESNSSIGWKFKSTSTEAHELIIFKDGNFSEDFDRYIVNTTEEGHFDLNINNTRLSDAGTYTCTEYMGSASVSHYSELVVLGYIPECDTNLTSSNHSLLEESDSLLMWCIVEFRGNLTPVMEWTNGANGEMSHSKAIVISNNKIYSEIVVKVKYKGHDVVISCTTLFDQTSVNNMTKNAGVRLNTTAKNIPDYSYTWTSPAVTILRKTNDAAVSTIPTTFQITEIDRIPLTTTSPANVSSVALMIVFFVAMILLCITIFCCAIVKKSNKGCFHKSSTEPTVLFEANMRDPTESDGFGTVSSQDASNLRINNPRVTFRQNDAVPFYDEITSEGGRTAANAVSVFYEDPIQTTAGRVQNRAPMTASGAAPVSQTALRQVNDHVYSAEPIQRTTSNEASRTPESLSISTTGPQLSYVGVWMEGTDGARGGSSEGVAAAAVSTYDYVDADLLRNIRSQETDPRPHENKERPTQNVGIDGTVYMEVNTASGSHVTSTMQLREPIQSLFNKSIYAPIDHTAQNTATIPPSNNNTTQAMSSYH